MLETLIGLITAAATAQAGAGATGLDYANLQFQKENARKQNKLARAGRTDVYGNKQSYDDLLNEWQIKLTELQNSIVKAGEREQLLSLTEDATRNRDLRRRQDVRSKEAGKDYNKALAGFRYDEPKSEERIRGDLTGLISQGKADQAKLTQSTLGRQAIRLGRGGDISKIINASNEQLGAQLPKTLLNARARTLSEVGQREGIHRNKYLGPMQQFAQLMDAVGSGPQRFSSLPQDKSNEQSQMLSAIMQALSNEGGQVGSAYGRAASGVRGNVPDFGGIGGGLDKLLALLGSGGGGKSDIPIPTLRPPQTWD